MSMVLISNMMLAFTGVKSYSQNSFPLLQMTLADIDIGGVIGCRKKVQGYIVTFGAIS